MNNFTRLTGVFNTHSKNFFLQASHSLKKSLTGKPTGFLETNYIKDKKGHDMLVNQAMNIENETNMRKYIGFSLDNNKNFNFTSSLLNQKYRNNTVDSATSSECIQKVCDYYGWEKSSTKII